MERRKKLYLKITIIITLLTFVPLCSMCLLTAKAAQADAAQTTIKWSKISPMPRARHSGATAVVDGIIYAIGGVETPGVFKYHPPSAPPGYKVDIPNVVTGALVEAYDPRSGTWTTKTSLPYSIDIQARKTEGRQGLAAVAYKGKIYTFGGASLFNEVKDTVDVYDVAADMWTAGIAKLPKPAVGMSAVAFGDKIYLFGGSASVDSFAAEHFYSQCYEFDPSTARITPKADMPNPRTRTQAMVFKNRILVLGGASAYGNRSAQVYDPSTDSWGFIQPVEWERPFWMGSVANEMFFMLGGRDEHQNTCATVDVYSDQLKTWVTGTNMPAPREKAFTAGVDGKIYIMGGLDNKGNPQSRGEPVAGASMGSPQVSAPALGVTKPEQVKPEAVIDWTKVAPMPTARFHGSTVVVNNIVYTIGGVDSKGPSKVVEAYDPDNNKWTTKASLPEAKFMFGAAAHKGKIYTFGGVNKKLQVVDAVHVYDIATDTWRAGVAKLPEPSAGTSALAFKDTIYLFGGGRSPINFVPSSFYYNSVYKFSPAALSFTPAKAMPIARNMTFTCVFEDKAYILGGFASPGSTANISFSLATQAIAQNTSLPAMRGGGSGAAADVSGGSGTATHRPGIWSPGISVAYAASLLPDKRIFIIGGGEAQKSILSYDPKADKWGEATPLSAGRNMPFVATVKTAQGKDVIVVAGGTGGTGAILNEVEKGAVGKAGRQ